MPREYAWLKYRQDMHIGWHELMSTPTAVIEHDIAMMNFEHSERPKIERAYREVNEPGEGLP